MIFQDRKLADWKCVVKLPSSFLLIEKKHWKKYSPIPNPKCVAKCIFPLAKVQQSQPRESKQNFFCPIFLSAILLSLLFSVLKDRGKMQGQKLWSTLWSYLKLFPKSNKHNGGCWPLSSRAGANFILCLDWHWPLEPAIREHITWETIQTLTGWTLALGTFSFFMEYHRKTHRTARIQCHAQPEDPSTALPGWQKWHSFARAMLSAKTHVSVHRECPYSQKSQGDPCLSQSVVTDHSSWHKTEWKLC